MPRSRPDAISFASCTASSISERGYAAAETCRRRLLRRAFAASTGAALAEEALAIRAEILGYYGAADLADAILAPSGTDAALLLTGLLTAGAPAERVTGILVSPTETGSGVPAAVRGRHFAECTSRGLGVTEGAAIAGFPSGMDLATVPLRRTDGTPFAPATTSQRFARAAADAAQAGRAILHMVDSSKTGLSAPSFAAAERLAGRHAGRLDIAVDACQARIDPDRTRRCLERGWPVLLTGSKFFGGPPFSGVILFPRERLRRILGGAAPPAGLVDYLGGGASGLTGLGDNPGLALRWAAALAEMREFARVPPEDAAALLARLGAGIEHLLDGHHHVHLVPSPRANGPGWSDQPSIFTIMMRDPADAARWLSPAALGGIYAGMNRDIGERVGGGSSRGVARQPHHIGQPVLIGQSPAGPIGGLRIAFGARHVQRAIEASRPDLAVAWTMSELGACLAKLSLILAELPELTARRA